RVRRSTPRGRPPRPLPWGRPAGGGRDPARLSGGRGSDRGGRGTRAHPWGRVPPRWRGLPPLDAAWPGGARTAPHTGPAGRPVHGTPAARDVGAGRRGAAASGRSVRVGVLRGQPLDPRRARRRVAYPRRARAAHG